MNADENWGHLYQNTDTNDIGLCMPPLSYYFRDFLVGTWADISIGFIHRMSATGSPPGPANDYAGCVNEALDTGQRVYLFQFGLTESNPLTLTVPITSNPYFIGWAGVQDSVTQLVAATPEITHLAATKVEQHNLSINGTASSFISSQGNNASPFHMYGIRFIYNSETGVLCMNHATQSAVDVTDSDDNVSTLTTFLQGISTNTTTPEARFTIADITHYKTFFINWPFLQNRLFLQAVGLIKNA